MQKLNAIGVTVTGPSYTVISTVHNEVVVPYNRQFLNGAARQVTKTSSISGAWFRSRSAKNDCWSRMSQRCVQPPVDLRAYGGRMDAL